MYGFVFIVHSFYMADWLSNPTVFAELLVTGYFTLYCRSITDQGEEERKLLRSLKKSVMSPYKKQVICLPPDSVADHSIPSSSRRIETRSFTSPRSKGTSSKMKPSPPHRTASKPHSSPRRSTPRKFAVGKTHVSTPSRKTKSTSDRKKTVLPSRRTPSKRRAQTPRKSTRRTPMKSTLTILYTFFPAYCFQVFFL